VWEHAVSHQGTRDIDGWVNSFAPDGVMEWPFTPEGVPRRAEGREAIRGAVGPVWERAKKTGRNILGHDSIVVHETQDAEVIFVEFDVYGEAAGKPFRQSLLYMLRARAGRIVLLRDYVDTARLNALVRATGAGA
jgi:ketosteroid isomerase-like protein